MTKAALRQEMPKIPGEGTFPRAWHDTDHGVTPSNSQATIHEVPSSASEQVSALIFSSSLGMFIESSKFALRPPCAINYESRTFPLPQLNG